MLSIVEDNQITARYDGFVQGYFYKEKPFYPSIGVNVKEVGVDLSWRSKLHFSLPERKEGELILWQLDLGLESLPLSLQDEGQCSAHAMAIKEFVRQLYEPMREATFGFSLYKGLVPMLNHSVTLDYLKLITAYLPEGPPLFLWLDGAELSLAKWFAITSKEHFFPFHLVLSHPIIEKLPYSTDGLGWKTATVMGGVGAPLPSCRLPYGFLLPHFSCEIDWWEKMASHIELIAAKRARLIPEVLLTEMWEGVEELYVLEGSLTSMGRRKLAGFEAAGGKVIFL